MKLSFIHLAILLSILSALSAFGSNNQEREFIWNEANSIMTSARSSSDYLRATSAYRKLIDIETRNSHIFYNTGTAYLKAEQYDKALTYLLRAERYAGSTPEIKRNILLSNSAIDSKVKSSLPWYRPLLFWHYALSFHVRLNIVCIVYTLFWLSLLVLPSQFKTLRRSTVTSLLLVIFLFGSSVIASIQNERSDRERESRAETITPYRPTGGRNQ